MNTELEKGFAEVSGGVCAAKGFRAAGIHCGFRYSKEKKDLALIVSDSRCAAAAVYTQNKVKGAPIAVTRRNIADGYARAIICNSGNANTCAPGGEQLAEETCRITAEVLGTEPEDIVVCSTGVIGEKMTIEPFAKGIPLIAKELNPFGSEDAAQAIMTTDTVSKSIAVEFDLNGTTCRIGGIAKGSGMIDPNMATMLSFITTDADIDPGLLQKALSQDILTSYNQICVDGDTSTNDMVVVLANGQAGNAGITEEGEAYQVFCGALSRVTRYLAKQLARDGEGATKLIECNVSGAPDEGTARAVSKSVISSNLLKAAIFGSDANWGRVLCAIGYTPGDFSADHIDVVMRSAAGSVLVCQDSKHHPYSEAEASKILGEKEIAIDIEMHSGDAAATAWGCDLTYDYVRINGDYRS